MRTLVTNLLFLCLVSVPGLLCASERGFDHSLWDSFLKKYVNDEGAVDYAAVKSDPALLNEYLQQMASQDPIAIETGWPREESLAFWMNLYNAGVVKIITEHYPIDNIQRIPSVWGLTILHVGEAQFSLNEIRSAKLLGAYKDEKIHFALACGAVSCPPLQKKAFTGENVEGQLFLTTRSFLSDPQNIEVVPGKKKIKLSRLFKWYAEDFMLDFGVQEQIGKFKEDEMAILSFLAYYLENEDQIAYLEEGRYKIDYFPFDWTLKDWKTSSVPLPETPLVSRVTESS